MLIQPTVGGGWTNSGGTVPNAVNDYVLRVVRNSYTKTATASTFYRGVPVILATASASTNGFDVVLPGSQGATPVNNLAVGLVWDYPDTTVGRTGGFNPEDVGLLICYGLHSKGIVSVGTVSMAPGLVCTPDSGGAGLGAQLMTAVGPVTAAATSTGAHTELAGIGGLFILAASVASSSASGTVQAAVLVRCM